MQYNTPNFTAATAKAYLIDCFKYCTELVSYSHEVTDNGVFTIEDIASFDNEELIAVAQDVHYDVFCSIADMTS